MQGIRYYAGDRIVVESTGAGFPTGFLDGAKLDALDTRKQYLLSGSVWDEITPIIWRENHYVVTSNVAASTLLGLPNGRYYDTGSTQLQVYCNGIYQRRNAAGVSNDYIETNSTGVSFNYGLATGTNVFFVIMR